MEDVLNSIIRPNASAREYVDQKLLETHTSRVKATSIRWSNIKRLYLIGDLDGAADTNKPGIYVDKLKEWVLFLGVSDEETSKYLGRCKSTLEELTLLSTRIRQLDIRRLTGLKVLVLKDNAFLSELQNLECAQNLETLDIKNSRISSVTFTKPMNALRNLLLNRNHRLAEINGLENLSSLEKLYLRFSRIDSVTIQAPLHKLTDFDAAFTSLRDIAFLAQLPNVQWVGLQGTYVSDLSVLSVLNQLRTLVLTLSAVSSVESVVFPQSLENLYLDNTKICHLPDAIGKLPNLARLNLSGLRLETLPGWLPDLGLDFHIESSETGICLKGTIIQNVDMSIFERSQEYILQWFEERKKAEESREDEAKPLNELKVVFLGDGEAGKSHTIARLLNDGIQVKKFRGVSTPGIVIEDKTYHIGGSEIKVHYWDFGGQEILHSMHRMFLTARTLYVVMLNVREGNQDDRARYWLHNLRSFANGAPVLLVLNKMDMNKNASVNESDLRELYPNLTDIVKLSTLTFEDQKFRQAFLDVLLKQIGEMDILSMPLTASGRRVKEKVQNMRENYIHGADFREFCDESGVVGSDNIRRDLLNMFGELGVSFCYSGSARLEDYVVLRPDWITNAIYIILFNKVEAVTNGLVTHDTIYRMLSSEDTENIQRTVASAVYTREEVDYVLNVVRKFRLSFPVEEEATEFMPMLCDANSTTAAKEYENDPETLEFRMHYAYLPNNVIHRLMVDHRKELDRNHVWLTGARFVCGDTGRSAVVKSEGNLLRIFVRSEGEFRDPQKYLDKLKGTLERINEEMGLTVAKMEVAYKENGKRVYFDYEDLLDYQESGETHIRSRELKKKLLLADVLMQSDFPEDEKQRKLRGDIWQACEMLQEDSLYWKASEDQRTGLLAKLLRAKEYIAMEQHRTGISAGGIQSGELDLDIRLAPGDSWSAMEALNLTGSSDSQIEYWNAHLKKLLDNYNHVGRSFLFHISYVGCAKSRFDQVCGEMYEHIRFHSPENYELQRRFVYWLPSQAGANQFVRAAKAVYDCGGIPMTVYHYFVRIGK